MAHDYSQQRLQPRILEAYRNERMTLPSEFKG